ncbi:MAG: hypothetical protein AAFR51_01885 [Pseudomonadota bacterium]
MTYFEDFVALAFQRKQSECLEALSALTARLAAEQQLMSGRRWVQEEKIFLDQIVEYAEELTAKLMEYAAEHSPIQSKDFELAMHSVTAFKAFCEKTHKRRTTAENSSYPSKRAPFDGDRLERATDEALHNIRGKLLEFESKKSFVKWAIGDARRRIWTGIMMSVGAALGHVLGSVF